MIFGMLHREKIWHQERVHIPTSPVYCSRLTFGYPKSHFSTAYSYILQIVYIISEENKLLPPYPSHLKNVTTLPCKMLNFFILTEDNVAFLQMLVAVKRACDGLALVALKRTACDVWQLKCQAGNVTAIVQSDHLLHGYTPPVFFATDQLHRPPRSAEIQRMLQKRRGNLLRSGLLAGHMSGLMNCGVSQRRNSTVSRARCVGALSCWKTNTSPPMLRITGSSFCISNMSR